MPLEVGGALRLRLEAVGRNHPPSLKLRRGKEIIRLRPTGYAATRRTGDRDFPVGAAFSRDLAV